MKKYQNHILLVLRLLVGCLFLFSAYAKLHPMEMMKGITTFETGHLIPMGFSESSAAYFSRFIIGVEFFLGITILFNYYLKRLIIPLSIIMITAFSIYKNAGGKQDFRDWYSDIYLPETARTRQAAPKIGEGIASIDPFFTPGPSDEPMDIEAINRMRIGEPMDIEGWLSKAQGGRIGYERGRVVRPGGYAGETDYENWLIDNYDLLVTDLSFEDHAKYSQQFRDQKAQGGRIGYQLGSIGSGHPAGLEIMMNDLMDEGYTHDEAIMIIEDKLGILSETRAKGGRVGKDNGGIMDLGGMEKDYRTTGGFVPLGGKERADDVPARLSKNEFVMTADAVRAAGGGSINRGAQHMYNVMKNLEAQPTSRRRIA